MNEKIRVKLISDDTVIERHVDADSADVPQYVPTGDYTRDVYHLQGTDEIGTPVYQIPPNDETAPHLQREAGRLRRFGDARA